MNGTTPRKVVEPETLCGTRKSYGHCRLPFDQGTIGREVADALRAEGFEADPAEVRQRI
jgi:hypothetical protein